MSSPSPSSSQQQLIQEQQPSGSGSSMTQVIHQQNEKFADLVAVTYNNPKFCDYKVVIGSTTLYIVSALVAAHSPVFAAMFSIEMVEKSTKTVAIEVENDEEEESKCFDIIFKFMHSGVFQCDLAFFVPCVLLAHKYEVNSLTLLCSNHIDKILARENCFHVFLSLQSVQSDMFKEAYERCLGMCASRLQTCPVEIFVNLTMPTLKKLITRAAQHTSHFNAFAVMRLLFEWVAHGDNPNERAQEVPEIKLLIDNVLGKYEAKNNLEIEMFTSMGGVSGHKNNYEITLSSSGGTVDIAQIANPLNSNQSLENSYGTRGPHWLQIKLLKNSFCATKYSITQENDKLLRNWQLEGSTNGTTWVQLRRHNNDTSFAPSKLTNSWDISNSSFYNYFRILSDGDFSIYHMELYGEIA